MASIIRYETESGEVALSADIVRRYLVSGNDNAGNFVTNEEIVMFIKLCQFQKLNPFLREAYLIKYSANGVAAMVTGKEVFTKRAFRNSRFDGFEAGITVLNGAGELIRREGALLLKDEVVIAGWCRVYLKNTRAAVFAEASFEEYAGRKSDGSLNKTWKGKPATMIRKVAVVQALREAFPEDLGGLYDSAEMQQDTDELPTAVITVDSEDGVVDAEYTVEPAGARETPAATVEAPQEHKAPAEPAEPATGGDDPNYVGDSTPPSNAYLRTVRFPNGRSPYAGQLVVDVVKTDLDYCERVAKESKSKDIRRDVGYIVAAYKAHLEAEEAKRVAEADAAASEEEPVLLDEEIPF